MTQPKFSVTLKNKAGDFRNLVGISTVTKWTEHLVVTKSGSKTSFAFNANKCLTPSASFNRYPQLLPMPAIDGVSRGCGINRLKS